MNIFHIVPHVDDEASGPSYSVKRLCEQMDNYNCKVQLLAILRGSNIKHELIKSFKSINLFNKLDFSYQFKKYLFKNSKQISLIHNHGLWSIPNNYGFIASRKFKIPLICSPRGTLSNWSLSNSKIKKFLYWNLIEKNNLKNVTVFHATSELEATEIRNLGFKQPIAIIPNGMDLHSHLPKNFRGDNYKLIYFARIHKKKGIETLINNWMKISRALPNWELVISGKGEYKYQTYIEKKISKIRNARIKFLGPLYGENKFNFLASGDIYILPTYSENFGLTIAESLSCGTPVISTMESSWSFLEKKSIGWIIPTDDDFSETLIKILKSVNFDKLKTMSLNSKQFINDNFNWKDIGKNTYDLYDWVLNKKRSKPNFIYE